MSLPLKDQRFSVLVDWLQQDLHLDIKHIVAASTDASFRRYFRVTHNQGQHIVMDAPPDKENTGSFVQIAELFRTADIHVPMIVNKNIQQGFLLLEDFGSNHLLDSLHTGNAEKLYQEAMDSLFRLQTRINIGLCKLPLYDQALLNRELNIFHDWFLEKRLGLVLPPAIINHLHPLLIESALEQPQVCVHRDFHSRNLMVLDSNSPGILDFQDAVIGPISYDLVSLLRDCYIDWPNAKIEEWSRHYYERLLDTGLVTVDFKHFSRWFDLMGLQRHLKAIGIFSRLHLRDGKSGYLADIPRTMHYICEITAKYPELMEFHTFLQLQVLPVYQIAL